MISAKDYLARLDQEAAPNEPKDRGYKGTKLPYLAAWRKHLCLSQILLAEFAELSTVCISQLEHGHHGAAPSTIHKLAEALRITPKQLVEECPNPLLSDRSTVALPHLSEWRRRAYLSQMMLAIEAEIDVSTVKAIERGRNRVGAYIVHQLAKALSITPQQLVAGPE